MNNVQSGKLLKSIDIGDVDLQQTLLVLPAHYLKQFTLEHCATFQELTPDTLSVSMVAKGQRPMNRPYKLVTRKGASWVSIPRPWLRNIAARPGDYIDLFDTADPLTLIVKYRKAVVAQE